MLDDVESADEDDIDNLMNNSDTEFIAEEKITQAASTEGTSLTTPEAREEERKEEKTRIVEVIQKSKSYQARRVSPRARNTTQSK